MNAVTMLIVLGVMAGVSTTWAQCTKDTDCKGSRICGQGRCVENRSGDRGGEKGTAGVAEVQGEGIGPLAIYLQPLGLVQFGPIAGMEIRVAPRFVVDAHLRYTPAGLVYQLIVTDGFNDDVTLSAGSMAIGGGVRWFAPSGTSHCPYLDGMVEFGWDSEIVDEGEPYEQELSARYLVAALDGGYRFRFGDTFFLGG